MRRAPLDRSKPIHPPAGGNIASALPARPTLPALLLAALFILPAAAEGAARPEAGRGASEAATLAAAEAAIAAGRPEDAVRLLQGAKSGAALLARSTAQFILGEDAKGRRDLDAALRAEPTLRQAWLHRAALAIADRRYDDARSDFARARDLDPSAADNDLNLGAAELLRGSIDAARAHFAAYGLAQPGAESHYAIASNYALAGYAALAAEELAAAIALDERSRVRAKGDPNFTAVAEQPALQALWHRDDWRPEPGGPVAGQDVAAAYDGGRGPLLAAALDALVEVGETPEARVEVTEDWALVWTPRLRVRLEARPAGGDGGSAAARVTVWPRSAVGLASFDAAAQRLLRQVQIRLLDTRRR